MKKEKIEKELISIFEKIDKSENTPKKILPLLYEFSLILEKDYNKVKDLIFLSEKFEKLKERVFEKTRKHIFDGWIEYKKKREKRDKEENKPIDKNGRNNKNIQKKIKRT